MINSKNKDILYGYEICEYRDTGILIAKKQVFLPDQCLNMVAIDGIIFAEDIFSNRMEGGHCEY